MFSRKVTNTEQRTKILLKKFKTLNYYFSFFCFLPREKVFILTVGEKAREDEDEGLLLRWPPTRGGRCFVFVLFFESSFSFFRKIFRVFFFKEEEEEAFERSRSSPTWEP